MKKKKRRKEEKRKRGKQSIGLADLSGAFQKITPSSAEDNSCTGADLFQSAAKIRDVGPDDADLRTAGAAPDLIHQLLCR